MSHWIISWPHRDGVLLGSAELCLKCFSDGFCDFALDGKNVSQLAIERVCPKVRVNRRFDQLHVDAHLISRTLYAAFENVRDPKLLGDLGQIARLALILLRGGA